MAIDLVCGMDVSETETKHHIEHNGERYYFCSARCKHVFANQQGIYMPPRKKGMVTRVLERLAKRELSNIRQHKAELSLREQYGPERLPAKIRGVNNER